MPRRTFAIAAALVLAIVAAPTAASAADGFARTQTTLRAGPGIDYPRLARIGSGGRIVVFGCLAGGEWCDVSVDGERGWMPGSAIALLYEGQRVRITDPTALGLGVLTFGMVDYWADHYRDRPWYGAPDHWRRHGRTPPPVIPGPAPHPPRPPVDRPTPVVAPPPAGGPPTRPRMPRSTAPQAQPPAVPTAPRVPPQAVPAAPRVQPRVTPTAPQVQPHVPPIFMPGPVESHIRSGRPNEPVRGMEPPQPPKMPAVPPLRPVADPPHVNPPVPVGPPSGACGPGQPGCR